MYRKFLKRPLDFCLAFFAFVVFSPLLAVLYVVGALALRGNPIFSQPRPGRGEKIFRLYKFRTMTNAKDANGALLPDDKRLTAYGRFVRSTSLDELPSLVNILKGDMSVVGPRPLLAKYLPLYDAAQRRRHEVRPGLTGWAQVNGRNAVSWTQKFEYDVWYVDRVGFWLDVRIVLLTALKVVKREGIASATSVTMEEFMGNAER